MASRAPNATTAARAGPSRCTCWCESRCVRTGAARVGSSVLQFELLRKGDCLGEPVLTLVGGRGPLGGPADVLDRQMQPATVEQAQEFGLTTQLGGPAFVAQAVVVRE